eukprot:CAMPEP_0170505146 /NCGR_PEP_ID=MMETSP0208-20121228/49972_1 /TAXON_ID=197538 /ORGANISM="Strombidium inclinatum, Strain S3" /LENGTH=110 /DNA_ID=CAMNT_0010785813 /DNA_START=425 /DNA_END=754 /DNA_ORIENTATION=-
MPSPSATWAAKRIGVQMKDCDQQKAEGEEEKFPSDRDRGGQPPTLQILPPDAENRQDQVMEDQTRLLTPEEEVWRSTKEEFIQILMDNYQERKRLAEEAENRRRKEYDDA